MRTPSDGCPDSLGSLKTPCSLVCLSASLWPTCHLERGCRQEARALALPALCALHSPTQTRVGRRWAGLNSEHRLYHCFSFSNAHGVLLTDYENKDSFPTDLGSFFFFSFHKYHSSGFMAHSSPLPRSWSSITNLEASSRAHLSLPAL